MNDDMFFFAVAAVAIAAQIAVSWQRPNGQPGATAAVAAARHAQARQEAVVRQMQFITVVGRRSDAEFPADQMARVEHDDR
jgi:hypothetical protein